MTNWGTRLEEVMDKHGLSQSDIARVVGKDASQISRYIAGKGAKNLTKNFERDLSSVFSFSEIYYIKTGENSGHDSCVMELSSTYNDDTISVPYYPEVYASAGGGAMVYESLTGTEPMQLSRAFVENFLGVSFNKNIHILNVKGDSMSPTIVDGELIFVSPLNGNGIVDGQIYVIMYEDEIYVKRIRKVPFTKRFNLSSDNPDVSDIELTDDQTAACKVIGEVVGQMRKKGQR